MPGSGAPPAGWLLDPDDPGLLRWWDGDGWSDFRRPRDLPAPPPPAPPPPPTAGVTVPDAEGPTAPGDDAPDLPPPAAAWTPQPLPPTAAPPPAPPPPPTAAPTPASPPPFWEQWDEVVLAVTGDEPEDVRRRRQGVAARVRDRVVAGAAEGERVLRVLTVSVHDDARSGREVGPRLFVADLLVTDDRLLLWADETDPDLALIEVAVDDVVGLRALPGPAAALDLAGGGRPLVLAARDAGRRRELLDLLHTTVPADRPRG